LLLGDPGMRDALMHGNQVCVPDGTLLPAGIERIHPGGARLTELAGTGGRLRYCATERSRDGDTYIYDIAVRSADGEVVERWEGLRLQAVRKKDRRGPWVAPPLGAYLGRTLGDTVRAQVAAGVQPHRADAADGVERRPARSGGGRGRRWPAAGRRAAAWRAGAGPTAGGRPTASAASRPRAGPGSPWQWPPPGRAAATWRRSPPGPRWTGRACSAPTCR